MKKKTIIIAITCIIVSCIFVFYDIRSTYQRKKRLDELNDSLNMHLEKAREASEEAMKALEKSKKIRKDTITEPPKSK
jgi:hypothetical protein